MTKLHLSKLRETSKYFFDTAHLQFAFVAFTVNFAL